MMDEYQVAVENSLVELSTTLISHINHVVLL